MFKPLVFLSIALAALASDDRIVVTHEVNPDWCNGWKADCKHYSPATSIILNGLCTAGDMGGRNPGNTSTVLCAVGTGAPGQKTLITHFVTDKRGGVPLSGPPADAC